MKFRQERFIFSDGCAHAGVKIIINNGGMQDYSIKLYKDEGYVIMSEDEYLTSIANQGWVLHTANYCVLGKQEAHFH